MTRSSDQPDIVSPTVLMQMALKRTNNAAVTMRPETASRPMPIHTLCRQPVTIATWHTSLSTNCKESGGKALQLRNSCPKQRRNDFCFNLFLHWSRASVVRTQRQFECGCGGNFLSKNDNEIACFVTAARCRLSSYSSFDLRQQYVSFTPDYLQKRRHLLSEHNIIPQSRATISSCLELCWILKFYNKTAIRTPLVAQIRMHNNLSPNSTWLVTSRHDSTCSTCRASRDERVQPCCSNMADGRRTSYNSARSA